jgi:hypothetical protein
LGPLTRKDRRMQNPRCVDDPRVPSRSAVQGPTGNEVVTFAFQPI